MGCYLLVAILAAGCGDSTKAAIDQQVANWREISSILQGVTDKPSMGDAEDRILSRAAAFKDSSLRFQRIGKADPAKLEAYPDEKRELQAAVQGVVKEVQRIKTLPGGDDFFKNIGDMIGGPK